MVANAPGLEAFGIAATLTLATTVPDTAMVGTLRTAVVVYFEPKRWWSVTNSDFYSAPDIAFVGAY